MILAKRGIVAVAIEGTYGVYNEPDPLSGAVLAKDIEINLQSDFIERDFHTPSLSPLPGVVGKTWIETSFTVELKSNGYTHAMPTLNPPIIGKLFRGCDMSEELVDESTQDQGDGYALYRPLSDVSVQDSLSISIVIGGKMYGMRGARGTWELTGEAGNPIEIRFTFTGLIEGIGDVTIPTATYESTLPPVFKNGSFNYQGNESLVVSALRLSIGNQVAVRPSVSASDGIAGIVITGRTPEGGFDPESVLETEEAFHTEWLQGTLKNLRVNVGTTPGNRIEIYCPRIQIKELRNTERDGIWAHEITFHPALESGDDEIQIKLT